MPDFKDLKIQDRPVDVYDSTKDNVSDKLDLMLVEEENITDKIKEVIKPILQAYLFERDGFDVRKRIAKDVTESFKKAFSKSDTFIEVSIVPNEIHRSALISITCLHERKFDVFIVPKSTEVKSIENA